MFALACFIHFPDFLYSCVYKLFILNKIFNHDAEFYCNTKSYLSLFSPRRKKSCLRHDFILSEVVMKKNIQCFPIIHQRIIQILSHFQVFIYTFNLLLRILFPINVIITINSQLPIIYEWAFTRFFYSNAHLLSMIHVLFAYRITLFIYLYWLR